MCVEKELAYFSTLPRARVFPIIKGSFCSVAFRGRSYNIRERRIRMHRGEDNELPFKPQNDQGFGTNTHTRKYIYVTYRQLIRV